MPTIEHKNITDPNIHEPKGVATAASGSVYIANGSGSGSWGSVTELVSLIQPASPYNSGPLTSGFEARIISPKTGHIKKLHFAVVFNTFPTTESFTITLKINGTAVTPTSTTINLPGPNFQSVTITANNAVSVGDTISLVGNNALSATHTLNLEALLEISGV